MDDIYGNWIDPCHPSSAGRSELQLVDSTHVHSAVFDSCDWGTTFCVITVAQRAVHLARALQATATVPSSAEVSHHQSHLIGQESQINSLSAL